VIFAAYNLASAESLLARLKKSGGEYIGGIYFHGWEKQYALIRLDEASDTREAGAFYEYAQSILQTNLHWLPSWLDVGICEFYSATVFRPNQIVVGGPTRNYDFAHRQGYYTIPIEKLITMNSVSLAESDKAFMYRAESWVLVHYMMADPGMQNGAKLADYFRLLNSRVEQKKAFVQAFGDFKAMDDGLHIYMQQFGFKANVITPPATIDEKTFASRTLSVAQTEAEAGGLELTGHDYDASKTFVAQALKDDPKVGLAHEVNGFLLFQDGKTADAADEFSKAYELDPNLYLAQYAKTMLSPLATSDMPADREAFRLALAMVVQLNPQFAPAYVQLARLAVRQGNLKEALRLSLKAEDLDPWQAGYHVQTGQILLRLGRGAEAAEVARYVTQQWNGADHNEAVELWNDVPADQRPAGDPPNEQRPDNTQQVEGIVKSTDCDYKPVGKKATEELSGFVLTLDHAGETLTFREKGFMKGGYSDTIWYGHDHFGWCHNVDGFRMVVNYRPPSNSMYSGDLVSIELRNDLPTPPSGASPAPAAVSTPAPAPASTPSTGH